MDSIVLEIAHSQLAPLLERRPEAITLLSQVLADRQTRPDRIQPARWSRRDLP